MNQLSQYPHLKWYVSNLRSIPAGTYRYGASPSQKKSGARISISAFRMGATPVTWGMWKEYCKSESVRFPVDPGWGYPDNHPVVNVSWDDIMNPGGFCEWASSKAGFKLTLPTDAQWEYAARGGRDGLEYPWGNEFSNSKLWCWDIEEFTLKQTASVDRQTASVDRSNRIYRNGYGLTDMIGNVWQWCSDYHNFDHHPTGSDPQDTRRSVYRCVRGGSWYYAESDYFRCASRDRNYPGSRSDIDGFRLSAGQK
jgi:sulfatase modifying factor 1